MGMCAQNGELGIEMNKSQTTKFMKKHFYILACFGSTPWQTAFVSISKVLRRASKLQHQSFFVKKKKFWVV